MNMTPLKNIQAVFDQATEAEQREGKGWYQSAHNACKMLATVHGISLNQACGITAALSPGLRWERNLEAAECVIAELPLDGIGIRWYANVRKAWRILNGETPEVVLGGNKVRAFYDNILQPKRSLSVCIDGHAFAIAAGKRITLKNTPNIGRRAYNRLSGSYSTVAKRVGIRPCELQAIVWVVWRRLHAVADGGNGRVRLKIAA
jgi:hypothetical protein